MSGNSGQVVGYKLGAFFGSSILFWFYSQFNWNGLFALLTLIYALILWFFNTFSKYLFNYVNSDNKEQEKARLKLDISTSRNGNKLNVIDTFKKSKTIWQILVEIWKIFYHLIIIINVEALIGIINLNRNNNSHQKQRQRPRNAIQYEIQDENDDSNHENDGNVYDDNNPVLKRKNLQVLKIKETNLEDYKKDDGKLDYSKQYSIMLSYVFIYKLGESGSLTTYPFYLTNQIGLSSHQVAFWNGTLAVLCSIFGSLIASKFSLKL